MKDLPLSISEFEELRRRNCVYVDKTKFVYQLIKKNTRTFLSRPRRFGKSLLVSTLESALKGRKEFFEGLWIIDSDYDWKPYGVIRLDFSSLEKKSPEAFQQSFFKALIRVANSYHVEIDEHFLGVKDALEAVTSALYKKFGRVALLIDEYDYPILHTLHCNQLALDIRTIIQDFSTGAKAQQAAIEFVFVTGVSAFSKSGLSSGLNNLTNLTMMEDFFDLCGYTDQEVDFYFKKHIAHWAELKKIPYEMLRADLKAWYNGYCFSENTPTIYSPYSLISALHAKKLGNFWFESATPRFLMDELAKEERQQECHFLHLDEMQGDVDLLQTFEIECIPLLALLFQMGYLTIREYDVDTGFYRMKYPNQEVKRALHKRLMVALTKTSLGAFNTLMSKLFSSLICAAPLFLDKKTACLS